MQKFSAVRFSFFWFTVFWTRKISVARRLGCWLTDAVVAFFIFFCAFASNIHISSNSNSNSVMILHFSFWLFFLLFFLSFLSFLLLMLLLAFFPYTISLLNKISILFSILKFRNFRFIYFLRLFVVGLANMLFFYVHRFHSLTLVGGKCCIQFVLYLDIFIVSLSPEWI